MNAARFDIDRFALFNRGSFRLSTEPTRLGGIKVEEAKEIVAARAFWLAEFQKRLFAAGHTPVLILLHGPDAAGKDGLIRSVFSQISPVGIDVVSYKGPSQAGQTRGVLADAVAAIPPRGRIGVMNRSFYETIMYERAVADFSVGANVWRERTKTITDFESYLLRSGVKVIKIFLHISRAVQRERLSSRFNEPHKQWKLTHDDLEAHMHFDDHERAFEQAIGDTASTIAPWFVIPADNKWISRAITAEVIAHALRDVEAEYPASTVDPDFARDVLGLSPAAG